MWAPDDFDPARGLVPLHLADLLAVAAEDRRAGEVRPAPILTPAGLLMIACGQALIRAGERLAGPPVAAEARG
jgi:hypothetical protein